MTFTTGCKGCGGELRGRQTTWCSEACKERWNDNHWWSWARARARINASPTGRQYDAICARCGERASPPEVNHKVPVLGKHDQGGCHHHQDGLEVLCRPCHRAETNAQRERGDLVRGSTGGDA